MVQVLTIYVLLTLHSHNGRLGSSVLGDTAESFNLGRQTVSRIHVSMKGMTDAKELLLRFNPKTASREGGGTRRKNSVL